MDMIIRSIVKVPLLQHKEMLYWSSQWESLSS